MIEEKKKVLEAVAFIQKKINVSVNYGIILGTGLSAIETEIKNACRIDYATIPHFPTSTAPSHKNQLVIGEIAGKQVICLAGRHHIYEGYNLKELTFPIRVLGELGVKTLFISNASGGTNETYESGDLVFIEDHINLTGNNPLIGKNEITWGPRFPDMLNAYDPDLLTIAQQACEKSNVVFKKGVYVGLTGPSLETPAEYQMVHLIGGDMVGMSTVSEVIVARHMDIKVCALSLVTNVCYPKERITKTTGEEVIANAQKAAGKMQLVLKKILQLID